ncbi:hypothetical protein F5Y17DRAFT_454696 [Xylariaceae sp. FL0594]|nr:hypothetical protein F5Y17DRAFT_454696 [Xylariaceae sp. FL0594]
MADQLLKIALELDKRDDAGSPPNDAEPLLQSGPGFPEQVSIEDLRDLISRDHDVSVSFSSASSESAFRSPVAPLLFCKFAEKPALSSQDPRALLEVGYTTLRSGKIVPGLGEGDNDTAALEELLLRIGHIMEPLCSGSSFDEGRRGELSLKIIKELAELRQGPLVLPARTLLSVIAYTNPDDPWSSPSCADLSQSLLSVYFQTSSPPQPTGGGDVPGKSSLQPEKQRFVTEEVLVGFLRPLFAKSRSTGVTASGRPAAFPEPPSRYSQGEGFGGDAEDLTITKPWKYTHQYAVTVIEWAVDIADANLLQQHWPLYTPVLLTLLDEPQPAGLRLHSLRIFRVFWSRCPEGLLSLTGLADVFEQAVFPTVLSLPSLTPEAESLALLGTAYPALLDMAGLSASSTEIMSANDSVKGPEEKDPATKDGQKLRPDTQNQGFTNAQRKLLDKIFREGIMVGYHHAKEHVRILDLLCGTLCCLVRGIGILAVKYLKKKQVSVLLYPRDIMHLVTEVLTDPFGTKYPPTLLSAIRLLQEVLQACWPRMPHYCNEVLRCTMLCWLNIEDDDALQSDQLAKAQLKQQLVKTMEMLTAVMNASSLDMLDRVSPLVTKEPQLQPLFACCTARRIGQISER